ncbi:MAG: hypothetical protein Q8M98_06890 [Candidatus Cloacimonadaceae bacterium]|nr:hypothetical protein [Candidatus Cloacimonadaceae bacterium]MDP3114486.1 hypothetical protein [Candidatus Cloacimonadaceae bacterium]
MNKKTKARAQGVAIFIVFLAIATTIFQVQRTREKGSVGYNFQPFNAEFHSLKWLNKAAFSMSSHNTKKTMDELDQLVKNSAITTLRKEKHGAFGVYTFSVKNTAFEEVSKQLRGIGNLLSTSESIDTSLININLEAETANLASHEKDLEELDKIRVPTDPEIRRKESLRRMRDKTKIRLENLKNMETYLLFVTIKPAVKGSGTIDVIKFMIITFLTWLGIYFVGLILVYFGTRLLMYLLGMMGIKGLGMSGVGGSYSYGGYTGYGQKYSSKYGYDRPSKRKIKRIYKDKKSESETEESDKS